MSAVELKKYSGLSLVYDSGELKAGEGGIDIGSPLIVTISSMRRQLLNADLSCPDHFYSIFQPIDRKSLLKRRNLVLSIFIIPQNLAGIEYVKTKGMNAGKYPLLVESVQGYITILMQNGENTFESDGVLTMVVKLKRGEKFIIPPNTDFVLINGRQMLAAVAMIRSSKAVLEERFDETRGASSYVIRKNARQEIVQNPYYRKVVRRKVCNPEEIYRYFGLTARTPIFKQILRKYDRFRWLHDADKIAWNKVPICGKY